MFGWRPKTTFGVRSDARDRREGARIVLGFCVILGLAVVAIAYFFLPVLREFYLEEVAPGVGLRQSAVISFFVVAGLFIVFAIFAGDGLIGEIQFMIAGFAVFFLISWLMIAWIF